MSDNGMTLEELRQQDDVQDLLDKLEHGIRSRYGISRALSDLGIPPDMVALPMGADSNAGLYSPPESQVDQCGYRKPIPPKAAVFVYQLSARQWEKYETLTKEYLQMET